MCSNIHSHRFIRGNSKKTSACRMKESIDWQTIPYLQKQTYRASIYAEKVLNTNFRWGPPHVQTSQHQISANSIAVLKTNQRKVRSKIKSAQHLHNDLRFIRNESKLANISRLITWGLSESRSIGITHFAACLKHFLCKIHHTSCLAEQPSFCCFYTFPMSAPVSTQWKFIIYVLKKIKIK